MTKQILDIDIGNSRSKWFLHGNLPDSRGVCRNTDLCQTLQSSFRQFDIARVRVACVAKEELRTRLRECCGDVWKIQPEFAASVAVCAGVSNAYTTPGQLGVDRWLAGLAAWSQSQGSPCLVVDAGSALTIDTIDDAAVFRGGYIIPGLVMMQQSLVANTGKIDCNTSSDWYGCFLETPATTAHAVHWGACFAVSAAVEKAVQDFLLRWPHGRVFVTGGDGKDVASAIGLRDQYQPDMVLDGLALAMP